MRETTEGRTIWDALSPGYSRLGGNRLTRLMEEVHHLSWHGQHGAHAHTLDIEVPRLRGELARYGVCLLEIPTRTPRTFGKHVTMVPGRRLEARVLPR